MLPRWRVFDHAYDIRGNLSALTELSGQKTFAYDKVERLTGVTPVAPLPAAQAESYAFDPEGNRIASHISKAYGADDANRILSDDANTFSWDRFGALYAIIPKSGAAGQYFAHSWDIFGAARLSGTGRGFDYTNFSHDGLDRLNWMAWNVFPRFGYEQRFYDGQDMVLEQRGLNTSTTQYRRFVHGQGTDQPLAMEIYPLNANPVPGTGTVYYFHRDGEGSVRLLTHAAGAVTNRYEYDSFGRRVSVVESVDQPYSWKGRERLPGWDVVYNRARFYSPQLGRFVEEDPIGYRGGDTNLYAFARNNVRNRSDPSGEAAAAGSSATTLPALKSAAAAAAVGCALSLTFTFAASYVSGGPGSEVVGVKGGRLPCTLIAIMRRVPTSHPVSPNPPMLPSVNINDGYWDAPAGSKEWGELNGVGRNAGRDRFHRLKRGTPGSGAADDYKVNPKTGDVIDPNGESVGNLDDVPPGKHEKGDSRR